MKKVLIYLILGFNTIKMGAFYFLEIYIAIIS